MMKCMILLVLLHLCYSAGLDTNLNSEILKDLEELNKLCKDNKVNFTSPDTVVAPKVDTYKNASSCVGLYSKELRNLLNNVTVHEDGRTARQRLIATLQVLEPYQENDNCKTKKIPQKAIKMTFVLYRTFFKRVNSQR